MISEIIPIWVRYYAKDIIKLRSTLMCLNSYNDKYHIYDHEFGAYKYNNEEHRKKLGIRYAVNHCNCIRVIASHYMAIKYVEDEESADLSVHLILKKRIIFPELYKDKKN